MIIFIAFISTTIIIMLIIVLVLLFLGYGAEVGGLGSTTSYKALFSVGGADKLPLSPVELISL